MRIIRLYSNRPDVLSPIVFNRGLSAILAEIRVPANRALDTHNLGKTTVGELIDFCLLKRKDGGFFLFKHQDLFATFTFYLELELAPSEYLTISRPVVPGSRIDFLRSSKSIESAHLNASAKWDHTGVPFTKAKIILDGALAVDALKPWGFRKLVGYLIRSQRDYQDVFQLGKFSGKHLEWKPFVAHLLGMNAQSVSELYSKREELGDAEQHLRSITREWGTDDVDASLLDGLISVKRRDVSGRLTALDSFNFDKDDMRVKAELVDQIEDKISSLNEEGYRLNQLTKRIEESLAENQILFDPAAARKLFNEAGAAFGDSIQHEFEQLIKFNHAITKERTSALKKQARNATKRLAEIDAELPKLNQARANSLSFLRDSDTLAKYKELSKELSKLQSELSMLESKREVASRFAELRREHRTLTEEFGHLETQVEAEIEEISRDDESRFGKLRQYFTEIIFEVLGQNAVLAIKINGEGGLDFTAEFIGDSGTATSGDRGTSYRKLLCIAFDLAMLRAYIDDPFPRFVYHDGALEQLEPRKQEKLIGVLRQYAEFGVQPIISLLDSDLPAPLGSASVSLQTAEVIVTLHDEGEDGRLFRMKSW